MYKLDLKDRKILYELELNARQAESAIAKKVERIVKQLNPQQLEEVIDFAEFLEFKNKKKKSRPKTNQPARLKQLEISVIKEVEYLGDPLLRREDIYDASGH